MNRATDLAANIVTLLEERIELGGMSGASVSISQRGERLLEWTGGRTAFGGKGEPLTGGHMFYLTSITKALVFTTASTLLAEGLLDLRDPVYLFLPALDTPEKRDILVVHLFTHTSGLPEFVARDRELRERHAPLAEFADESARAPLGFTPGSRHQYSNAGTLLLARVVETILAKPLPTILSERLCGPTNMDSTILGWNPDFRDKWVEAKSLEPSDWDHNSSYWRELGAPWASAHSTAADLQRLMDTLLNDGMTDSGRRVLPKAVVDLFGSPDLARVPSTTGRQWALGWEIQTGERRAGFGSLVPTGAFGHTGAAGTVMWMDPASGTSFVLLTNGRKNGPANEGRALRGCSNLAAGWVS